MKNFLKKNILTILGVLLGALSGFLYWKFIGCSTGSCAITSNPTNSTLYGAAMGGLLLSISKKDKKQHDISGNNKSG